MRLCELTAEEIAFLAAPVEAVDCLEVRLQRALEDTLRARLRGPVRLARMVAPAPTIAPAVPVWHVDPALAALWLTRRLGGHDDGGRAPFVPRSLFATLDAVLAERWLDTAGADLPGALAWQFAAGASHVSFGVALPRSGAGMTRWARQTIRGSAA